MNVLEMFIYILIHVLRGIFMYSDDIKDLKKQKREAKLAIITDFIKIYFQLKIAFPSLVKEREDLVKLVGRYLDADENETEVLNKIGKIYGKREDHEGVDELLEEFDEMFENMYEHCQRTFLDYETFLEDYGDFFSLVVLRLECALKGTQIETTDYSRIRMIHYPIHFQVFDEAYKQKMLEFVPKLPEPVEEEF